jgi:hypothetical protein
MTVAAEPQQINPQRPCVFTLESGATYSIVDYARRNTKCRVHLDGTTEQLWVDHDPKTGRTVDVPPFAHVRAQTTALLEERLRLYERAERMANFQTVMFSASPTRINEVRAELARRKGGAS